SRRWGLTRLAAPPHAVLPMRQQQSAATHGIHTLDTGDVRPSLGAAYLVVEQGSAAFVDCGTNHSVPLLLQALADAGLGADAVDAVVLADARLDHAGGAGVLTAQRPDARAAADPRGAPQMIDRRRLVASATAVYGEEELARHDGEQLPVPEERLVAAGHGQVV